MKHTERTELVNARRECYVAKSQDACDTVTTLDLKDKVTTFLIKNAIVTCKGSECWEVLSQTHQYMGSLDSMSPQDAAELKAFRIVALQKSEGSEPVYSESWLLDVKAALDIANLALSW